MSDKTATSAAAIGEHLRLLGGHCAIGFWEITREGYTTYINPAMLRMLELDSPEELEGITFEPFFNPGSLEVMEREQVTNNRERLASNYETELIGKKGTRRAITITGVPLFDGEGHFKGLMGAFTDITAIRRTESDLDRVEREQRVILDTVPAMIWFKDRENRILRLNRLAAATSGGDVADFEGKSAYDIFPHDAARYHADDLEVINSGLPKLGILEPLTTATGDQRWVQTDKIPYRDEEGNIRGVIVFAQDVTDRVRAEDQRRALENRVHEAQRLESLGVLAGGIAHDFNNLLVGIMGGAGAAMSMLPENHEAARVIKMIETAALRASELTREMLAYSGKGRFVVEPLDLSRVVEEMTHLLESSISKKAALRCNFAHTLPKIEADAAQIRQIVMNLIINASDALGGKPGTITISTSEAGVDRAFLDKGTLIEEGLAEGRYACVEVSDTGCGMDDATRERIFDPFFTTKATGRGLGLAAVLGIVRGHRGFIRVEGLPGHGSTFRVGFPCLAAARAAELDGAAATAAEAASAEDGAPPAGSGEILVVDDEETVLMVTRAILESSGFVVRSARNGFEAITILGEGNAPVSVVLLDMTMPGLSGEETFQELRNLRPNLPILLMSGYNEQEAVSRFAGKGMAGFMQKPFRAAELIDRVRKAGGTAAGA